MKISLIIPFLMTFTITLAQQDTIRYQWPVPPFKTTQPLTATFCEFRNTLSSDHFHNAVDIAENDGNPVYPCLDGIVHTIASDQGSNSYVTIRTQFGSVWKRLTYLHIVPNPSLILGQSVTKGSTVIGSIYPGQGHTHLIERELVSSPSGYAVEINNIREGGGLDPYLDPYAPVISRNSLQFRVNQSNQLVPANGLAGKIDIIIRVDEKNGTSSSHSNNGTYILGYRVLSTDTSSIIYEPASSGVKYRFDTKPSDDDVHEVFLAGTATLSDPVYVLTNGLGADYINNYSAVTDNFLDTETIDVGDYILEIFTEDTRGNTDRELFNISITRNDIVPPTFPVLKTLLNDDGKTSVRFSWSKSTDTDILGYRLYYSRNTAMTDWALAADERVLKADMESYYIPSAADFIVPPLSATYFFRMTAVDSTLNESAPGDIYSRSSYFDGSSFSKALIVDGFDRYGSPASWQSSSHNFNSTYFRAMTVSDSVLISSCANESVSQGAINLNNYDIVVWFVGDESTNDKTFDATEQESIINFLENGGKLLVSGSEIGWDLDRSHSNSQPSDTLFFRHYLKSRLAFDGNVGMNTVSGIQGTFFEGLSINIGQVYPEDYPDDIEPVNGGGAVFNYNVYRDGQIFRKAGVCFRGIFGNGSLPGSMLYLSFPFETVYSFSQQINFMKRTLEYFETSTSVENGTELLPPVPALLPNYPNPFNPETTIRFIVADGSVQTKLEIFDILGNLVDTPVGSKLKQGEYEIRWNGSGFASGVYIMRLVTGDRMFLRKMLLLK